MASRHSTLPWCSVSVCLFYPFTGLYSNWISPKLIIHSPSPENIVDVTKEALRDRLIRDVYPYECKLWVYPRPCGRGDGVAAYDGSDCLAGLRFLEDILDFVDPEILFRIEA